MSGQKNGARLALGDKSTIYWPVLYVKLGLIKMCVKVMGKESEEFDCLRQKFPKLSEAKMKDGIFIGPQVKQLYED
jgi:hypothetical protein